MRVRVFKMVRVKRGNVARKRRNKILNRAKGFRGSHSLLFRTANQQVMKVSMYAYTDRKQTKKLILKDLDNKSKFTIYA